MSIYYLHKLIKKYNVEKLNDCHIKIYTISNCHWLMYASKSINCKRV